MIEPDVWAEILDADNRRAKELIDMWHDRGAGQRYSELDIKREAHRLLSARWHANAPPSTDILSLFAEILGLTGQRTDESPQQDTEALAQQDVDGHPFVGPPRDLSIPVQNQAAFLAAVAFEAGHPVDETATNPSTASVRKTAQAAFPETDANRRPEIRKWRQMPEYRERVEMYRNAVLPILERLFEHDKNSDAVRPIERTRVKSIQPNQAPLPILGAEKSIEEEHRELFHYTSIKALTEILESNNLWATKSTYLNDSSEIDRIWPHLIETLIPYYANSLKEFFADNIAWQRSLHKSGGTDSIAGVDVKNYVGFLRSFALGTEAESGFAEPYITSFSTHSKNTKRDKYRREHGMLSQWHGYAKGGGVAIAFESKKLMSMFDSECAAYSYWPSYTGDVVYDDEPNFMAQFPDLLGTAPEWMKLMVLKRDDDVHKLFQDKLGSALMIAAGRLKHHAFREECECRIVAIPTSEELGKSLTEIGHPVNRPLKTIHHRPGDYIPKVPFIKLFDAHDLPLPITRIIVGPSRTQKQNEKDVISAVGDRDIEVTLSETPLIGKA